MGKKAISKGVGVAKGQIETRDNQEREWDIYLHTGGGKGRTCQGGGQKTEQKKGHLSTKLRHRVKNRAPKRA